MSAHRTVPVRFHARPDGSRPATADRRERGIIVPLTALSMVTVLLVASVVIDGSAAYPQRRRAQNAADAAAVAAARALDKVKFSGASWTTVDATATSIAANNGAEGSTCTIVTSTGGSLGPCSSATAVTSASAAGVVVVAQDTRPTTFGRLSGRSSVTAPAKASATIQTFAGTRTPFVVCGNPAVGGYPILNPDNTINVQTATAMGTIDIQSSQVPTCGAGAAFKGKIGDTDPIVVPGWVSGDNGNGYEQEIADDVLGAKACPTGGPFDGCDMLIPIADLGNGNGNAINMHAVAWAVFHVTGNGLGNPKYQGRFRADLTYVGSGASTSAVPTSASSLRIIRLIS